MDMDSTQGNLAGTDVHSQGDSPASAAVAIIIISSSSTLPPMDTKPIRKNAKKFVMRQVVQYSKQQVYTLVTDVECYPDFVPFCCACKLVDEEMTEEERQWSRQNPESEIRFASTTIGFKAFNETYISRIKSCPYSRVEVQAYSINSKLFYQMQSIWEFSDVVGCTDQCEICFTTEFEFKSALYSQVAGYFLDFVANKNMEAFISRLSLVYGPAPSAET